MAGLRSLSQVRGTIWNWAPHLNEVASLRRPLFILDERVRVRWRSAGETLPVLLAVLNLIMVMRKDPFHAPRWNLTAGQDLYFLRTWQMCQMLSSPLPCYRKTADAFEACSNEISLTLKSCQMVDSGLITTFQAIRFDLTCLMLHYFCDVVNVQVV